MTVIQGIIKWLQTFEPTESWKMRKINTDILPAKISDCAVVKEPIVNRKSFISGKTRTTGHYTLMTRLDSQLDDSRIENNEWGESLEQWIEEKNRNKQFPDIDGTVQEIAITTPFYVGVGDMKESIYQLTISITYEREKKA